MTTTGKLDLQRLSLTGGGEPVIGGSVYVAANANSGDLALTLREVAVVDNSSSLVGGAIYVGPGTKASIQRSVVTNGTATNAGGGIAADDGAEVTLFASIIAKNAAGMYPDLTVNGSGTFVSAGNNLIGDIGNSGLTLDSTDYESPTGTVDHVVTTILDTFDPDDDDYSLSLREAINLANENDGTLEEIWLPAWNFVLTRDRVTYGDPETTTDVDVSYGDLDIGDSLVIRGTGAGLTSVRWKSGTVDAIFDLLGDYDDSGLVGASDFIEWQRQLNESNGIAENQSSAEGDDDGDVDGDDHDIWDEHYGNSLDLENLDVIPA